MDGIDPDVVVNLLRGIAQRMLSIGVFASRRPACASDAPICGYTPEMVGIPVPLPVPLQIRTALLPF